jgi:hypothetical protein
MTGSIASSSADINSEDINPEIVNSEDTHSENINSENINSGHTRNSLPWPNHSISPIRPAISRLNISAAASAAPPSKSDGYSRSEVVAIVDASVEQYPLLVAAIVGRTDVPIVVLDPDQNSIEQITELLQSYTKITALYLISQSCGQRLFPGSTCLNQFNLETYGWQIQQWAESFSNHAKIFLYGCEIADPHQQQTFVQRLSLLTGMTVLTLPEQKPME